MGMLPLDSPRWKSFSTYFGTPEQVPQRLASWRQSIGSPDEESQWCDLWEQFLHQGTITDAAYAAVPHVVWELDRVEPRKRFDYLVELALIESARQTDGGAPALAADLADSYHAAIREACRLSVMLLSLEWPKIEFRYLTSILASLHGHGGLGDLIFHLDGLCGQCPRCSEFVYPDRVQDSGYVK
jgi:hypothetical protein